MELIELERERERESERAPGQREKQPPKKANAAAEKMYCNLLPNEYMWESQQRQQQQQQQIFS